ncbi:Alpha-1,2 glucosyltransferase alg10 [Taphrina deformans PYCC 5710]|uniref:Dol-P-Glc:Glc(2)Man(9)GlcNAc(2)-PP-Dol alpha-1,2-glucosyltransferase n=1 Tax=Taphrina deformans (strain PYCC 5710 / ATCC 11124 / CBS 356.35 / IMI 108563 / JCM 9778 / NBRC 8474) TaxID=1097556 RepID=R4XCA7_TAPDE|nr:Alpha-1,2 glucosyltransferase alg10 [Taphrina deformans PYCC 5710]|eukprot:CCG83456.1 Alpha-1,2 glucosyltransferase alg10 [Taphrina deformans PYCC 5710]
MFLSIRPRTLLNVWRVLQIISFAMINDRVSIPYMDEKFHAPQAAAYCRGQFLPYDPKLTTPPGLYLISYALSKIGVPCTLSYLRGLNLFIGIILLPNLCGKLYDSLHAAAIPLEVEWSQCLSAMPILSFFSLLYYTDLASTYAVLLVYYLTLTKRRYSAALVAFASLWFRQTNLVWVVAFVAQDLFVTLQDSSSFIWRDRLTGEAACSDIVTLLSRCGIAVMKEHMVVLRVLAPFVPIALSSVAFLLHNGSIVLGMSISWSGSEAYLTLGDKSMHKAGIYPIQLCYMSIFTVSISGLFVAGQFHAGQLQRIRRHPKMLLSLLLFSCAVAVQKSIQHPFLLADNRHFPFYLNKRIIQKLPNTLLGLFFFVASSCFYIGMLDTSSFTTLVFLAASALTLCPTSLLEFRYYIVPFMLWRLHFGHKILCQRFLLLETVSWIILNLGCVYIFLYHGFYWQDSMEIQRFMW